MATFTPMAKTIFCRAIASVFRASLMAVATFPSESSMRTTSAASIAASDPRTPIAIPTSALASTGASFMPSPTNASVAPAGFSERNCSTAETLSCGNNSERYSSIPRRDAISAATSSLSPVSITTRETPACLMAETEA